MNFNYRFYWHLFLRRLPVMTALVLICSGVGIVTALKLPPTYSTSARLLVETPQIPDEMAASMVRVGATEQLQVIEQQLLTRANLIDIANKFKVLGNQHGLNPDQIVAEMRTKTRFQRSSGQGQATLMTLSFEAANGQIAANVVNEYVTLILQANNAFRMSRTEGTLSFFEQEVQTLSQQLDRKSKEIIDFKNANIKALPDDLNYRMGRQAMLQERLSRLERDRAAIENQRQEVTAIFQATGQVQTRDQERQTPEEAQLKSLEFELEGLLSVLSNTNPKVVILQGRIDNLRKRVAEQTIPSTVTQEEPVSMLDIALAEVEARLKALDREATETRKELDKSNAAIAATSGNTIGLNALERDYNNIQARYTAAVNNLSQAQMGERIEVSSQGQRISIIEGASVPQEPSGPNRLRLATMGVGSGLALAAGFFFLLEVLNRTIRRPAELRSRFGIIPIATIPYMESRTERFIRRTVLVTAFLAVLIGVPAALWYIDTTYMPLEILADKVMRRMGLS